MRVQVDSTETPNASVMRLENSPEMSSCRAGGTSSFLNEDTVGSDNSSATQGSSTVMVAGKKRAPTKQCASASVSGSEAMRIAHANGRSMRNMEYLLRLARTCAGDRRREPPHASCRDRRCSRSFTGRAEATCDRRVADRPWHQAGICDDDRG